MRVNFVIFVFFIIKRQNYLRLSNIYSLAETIGLQHYSVICVGMFNQKKFELKMQTFKGNNCATFCFRGDNLQ